MKDFNGLLEALAKVLEEVVRFGLERMQPGDLSVAPIGPGLLNREQTAAYLGVGTTTFDALRKAKAFPEVGIAGKPRWRRADLDRYILKLKIAG